MKKLFIYSCIAIVFLACSRVPVTNRKQLNLLPESTMLSMSLTSYTDYLSKNKVVSENEANAQLVQKVGKNISLAVEKFLREKKLSKRIEGYKWEFKLVNENTINAWCMPGGKVVVYTGLLSVTKDENGLAVVMGHEIAHAIARHGNERMSQGLIVQLGGIGLSVALSQKQKETQDIFMQSYGVASTLGTLKYSRSQESEADKMGIIFMAIAGYNPETAVGFWERMAQQGGGKQPELLSTHPSDVTRIKDIKDFLPEAKKYYTIPI